MLAASALACAKRTSISSNDMSSRLENGNKANVPNSREVDRVFAIPMDRSLGSMKNVESVLTTFDINSNNNFPLASAGS